jgi:hypothetical protein
VAAAVDSTAVVAGSAAATVVAAAADTGKVIDRRNGWPWPAVSFCALVVPTSWPLLERCSH